MIGWLLLALFLAVAWYYWADSNAPVWKQIASFAPVAIIGLFLLGAFQGAGKA